MEGFILLVIILFSFWYFSKKDKEEKAIPRWKKHIKITDTSKFNTKNFEELDRCIMGCRVECSLAGYDEGAIVRDEFSCKKLCLLYDSIALGYIFGCIGHFEDEDVRVHFALDVLTSIAAELQEPYAASFANADTPENRAELVFNQSFEDVMVDVVNFGQDESKNDLFWNFIRDGEMNRTFTKFQNFADCLNEYSKFDNHLEQYKTLEVKLN